MSTLGDQFDWGLWKDTGKEEYIEKEIFVDRSYEKFVQVEEGDIVVDVGASVGPFTKSILDKKPKTIYCIEPDKRNLPVLKSNLKASNVKIIEKGIGPREGYITSTSLIDVNSGIEYSNKLNSIEITKFSSFIKENTIDHIDFLKLDCEGFEYDILNKENRDWILENVRKISGEFHLHTADLKSKFNSFRSNYLHSVYTFRVFDVEGNDITHEVYQHFFVPNYLRVYVSIDNTKKAYR